MPETPIKLGLMPPLTGLVGLYGNEISLAGRIACEEVNENGGVLGRPLELIIEDDGSMPESAVAAANKLLDVHHCSAMIGNLLSNSRIAVAYRVAEPRRIPYLNFSFYEGSILSRYFFHFGALPNQQIDRMIPFMREKYGPRMFFAGNNYEWPRGSIDAAKRVLIRNGGIIAGEEYCPIDVSSQAIDQLLEKVQQSKPDVFVPYFAGADQVYLLTRFTERGLKNQMAVVMGHYDEMMASKLPPQVRDGFYSSNTYFMSIDNDNNRNYLKRLAAHPDVSGIWPEGNGILTNFGEGTYVCVKAFAQAANKAGGLEPEALVDALQTVSVSAPQGTVEMRHEHHAKVNTYLSRCDAEGVFTIVNEFGAIEPVLPERYSHQRIGHQANIEDDLRLQARMLEEMSEAVFLSNTKDETIIYANAGADRMFGCNEEELVGKSFAMLFDCAGRAAGEIAEEITAILSSKGAWQGEIQNIRNDGTPMWCSVTVSTFTHPLHGEVWMSVHRDITQLKTLHQQLEQQQQHLEDQVKERTRELMQAKQSSEEVSHMLRTVLDTVPLRIFWKDRDLRYLGCNRLFAQDSGHNKPEELIGKNDYDMRWIASAELYRGDDKKVITTGEAKLAFEEPMDLPNGSRIYLATNKVPLKDTDGNIIGVLGTFENITARRQTEQALIEAKNEAERASYAKSEFLSRMSHELRTPMNAILGFAQVLEFEELTSEQHNFLAEIVRAGNHLLELINELLDLSRIEAGKLATTLQPTILMPVVKQVLQMIQPQAAEREINIVNQCTDTYSVLTDHTRLRQILVNLLTNAVKYNRQGGRVTITCTPVDKGKLRISITDTGQGITPDKLEHVFTPFERLGAEFSGIDGTGIGLALSNQLARLMGGELGVHSTPGQGSTFWIELPLTDNAVMPNNNTDHTNHLSEESSAGHPRTILYVEDNPANMRLVEAILRHQPQLRLLSATNGEHGLELAQQYKPDAIILDIHLPGMDGYDVLTALTRNPDTRDIPVLALSADAMPIDVERGLKSGFAHYLTKPVMMEELVNRILQVLQQ